VSFGLEGEGWSEMVRAEQAAPKRGQCPSRRGFVASLVGRALTYPEWGATAGVLPTGYRHIRRSIGLGVGPRRFDGAAERLLSWEMHRAENG
jgi:hypothetical protein